MRLVRPYVRLSSAQKEEMKKLRSEGSKLIDIATQFNCAHSTASVITNPNPKTKARAPSGSSKKLSQQLVHDIVTHYKKGESIASLSRTYNVGTATIAWHVNKVRNQPSPVSEPKVIYKDTPAKLITFDGRPTSENKRVQGTQVLDLKTRDLYVQVSSDENLPHWVLIERYKKGLVTSIIGWFKKT